jgi:hypothetical protein
MLILAIDKDEEGVTSNLTAKLTKAKQTPNHTEAVSHLPPHLLLSPHRPRQLDSELAEESPE